MTKREIRAREDSIKIYATVSGSFRKALPEIRRAIRSLNELGINVLSPRAAQPVGVENEFVILEGDVGTPVCLERKHLEAIGKSDFLYIVNPDGYIGPSTAMEIGYAVCKGVPVYACVEPNERVFSGFVTTMGSLAGLREQIIWEKRRLRKLRLKPSPTLADLQEYVARVVVQGRGFSEEGLIHVALLLIEEVGELAEAIRVEAGLKSTKNKITGKRSMAHELADCLVYLLDLANLAGIDLERALRAKEAINVRRIYSKDSGVVSEKLQRERSKDTSNDANPGGA